jgi:hypothetical protein
MSSLFESCGRKSPESCGENPGNGKLLIFIGEKISVTELPIIHGVYDLHFRARYKILEKVCGDYDKGIIEFFGYDHYGRPAFEKYDPVLLYVSLYEDSFYHEKYQYSRLYRTKDGRWGEPYFPYTNWSGEELVQPQKIEFENEVSFSLAGYKKREILHSFPKPYYEIRDGRAFPLYGYYVPDLVEIEKRTVLRARGLFGPIQDEDDFGPEVKLLETEEIKMTRADVAQLKGTWWELYGALSSRDSQKIRTLSLDTVTCSICEGFASPRFYNDPEPIDTFITYATNLRSSSLWDSMTSGKFKIGATRILNSEPTLFKLRSNQTFDMYELEFNTEAIMDSVQYSFDHKFEFVKIDGKFVFHGVTSQQISSRQLTSPKRQIGL